MILHAARMSACTYASFEYPDSTFLFFFSKPLYEPLHQPEAFAFVCFPSFGVYMSRLDLPSQFPYLSYPCKFVLRNDGFLSLAKDVGIGSAHRQVVDGPIGSVKIAAALNLLVNC